MVQDVPEHPVGSAWTPRRDHISPTQVAVGYVTGMLPTDVLRDCMSHSWRVTVGRSYQDPSICCDCYKAAVFDTASVL
jgi:hypothetical protein